MSFSPALSVYRGATSVLGAFASAWLGERVRAGKEDPERIGERFARYAQPRPHGILIWLHAASVGESSVALALIEGLAARDGAISFLLSTGTRTSAELVSRRAPPRTTHVYAPLDRVDVVRRFLAHWRPDLGMFVESEVWPNLILEAQRANLTLALVNARMSPKSLARWRNWGAAGARLMRAFAWVSAADARTADALAHFRGEAVTTFGNLKLAAPAPHVDADARAALAAEIGARPLWLAASTHAGEEEIVIAAHTRLREIFPDALLIIAPRHPERGATIAAQADDAPRRAQGARIGAAPIYIADTLGELGTLYDLAPIALIGGSMLPRLKGHNPIEPAKLGAAILTGPHVESFEDLFKVLFAAGGAAAVHDEVQLADAIAALWRDETQRTHMLAAAQGVIQASDSAFESTITQMLALLPRSARMVRVDAPA